MFGKKKVAALVAEFVGTGVLTLLILSVQRSQIGLAFFVALAAGLALALTTFALHESSAAHFNPALTIALWTARKVETLTAVLYIAVQLLGGWAAYFLFRYYVNAALPVVGGHYLTRTLVAEGVGTAIFAFGVAATVYKRYEVTSVAAFSGIAYALGIIAASSGSAAIGLLNPAVALGIRAWVWGTYVLGPVVGALIGVNLYAYLFADNGGRSVAAAVAAPKKAAAKKPAAKKRPASRKKK
ncbi:MAG TPA: aquaporin [Candidatus Saccharimonadales bacterium]|nr:aquaporin [Candidatus Saccharimonadales bacterium]